MKTSLVFCTAALTLALAAPSAFAVGLTLNWGGCVGSGISTNQDFDCSGSGGPYRLVMEIQPPALAGYFAMDLELDLQISGASIEPTDNFWNMSGAACNATGLSISANQSTIPNVGCLATMTGETGANVSSLITDYNAGYGGANRARILVTVARPASSPITLVAGDNYYVAHLLFSLDNASEAGGACQGCTDQAAIVWSSATLYSTDGPGRCDSFPGPHVPMVVTGPGLSTNCASINGGVGLCNPSPTINGTGAQLKTRSTHLEPPRGGVPLKALGFGGGLTTNWGKCIGSGFQPSEVFDCVNLGGSHNLVFELQAPALSGFFAMDLYLDLQVEAPDLGPAATGFWHMECGACNTSGLSMSANRSTIPNVGCLSTITGSTGANVHSVVTAYSAGFGGANRARIQVTVARSAASPISLAAHSNYYVSHLIFSLDNASERGGGCDGCALPAVLVWNSAVLFSLAGAGAGSPEAAPVEVDSPGRGTNCATINGGVITCAAVPTLNRTWGQLKALYR